MSFVAQPRNYSEMLSKIFLYTFAGSLLGVWILVRHSPQLLTLVSQYPLEVNLGVVKVPLSYVAPAFLVAWVFRILKFHDRISDLAGIRERFDIDEILIPLADAVGVSVTANLRGKLKSRRDDYMRICFYRYASSRNPRIDEHLIVSALDKWSWFWIALELSAIAVLVAIGFVATGEMVCAAWSIVVAVVLGFVVSRAHRCCAPVARAEVSEILSNQAYQEEVRRSFNEI